MSTKILTTFASTALLALSLTACGGSSSESSAHVEDEAHEHSAETHTHERGADTAGTYTDTTGAFFSDDDTTAAGHEHDAETHTH